MYNNIKEIVLDELQQVTLQDTAGNVNHPHLRFAKLLKVTKKLISIVLRVKSVLWSDITPPAGREKNCTANPWPVTSRSA